MENRKLIELNYCDCGCKEIIDNNKRFVSGHNTRIDNPCKYMTEQTFKIISENAKKRLKDKTKNPMYGKHHSEESKKKMSESKIGNIPWNKNLKGDENYPIRGRRQSNEHIKKRFESRKGYRFPEEVKKRMSISQSIRFSKPEELLKVCGANSSQWKGGISIEPYCDAWADKEYKQSIKERDNNKCQNLLCWDNNLFLIVHHINYDKKNCKPNNLITLCNSCNARANSNRKYWAKFYNCIIKRKIKVLK